MAVSALSQENFWVNKSTYDAAERSHYERLYKVASRKILECNDSKKIISTKIQDFVPENLPTKSSSKKSKENKNKADKKNKYLKNAENDATDKKEVLNQESRVTGCSEDPARGSLANEVAKARQHIKKGLQCLNNISEDSAVPTQDLMGRLTLLEKDNRELHSTVKKLNNHIADLEAAIKKLEITVNGKSSAPEPHLAVCPAKPASAAADDDDDLDLFGADSEGEDAEAAKIREERLAAYAAKKSKKPAVIAKSSIVLDVKPWDDETDMKEMEALVRKITCDGLLWGAAKLVPLAYKIHKLQISCVVEDDKVSVDWLTEEIEKHEDFVQSVDIAAFNKI